jgi:hypothetical protein
MFAVLACLSMAMYSNDMCFFAIFTIGTIIFSRISVCRFAGGTGVYGEEDP